MARVLFLAFSGGGNLPPSLAIARELAARGHEVTFAGEPEMTPRMKTSPFRHIELTRAYEQIEAYPPHPVFGRWFCGLSSPAVEEQAQAILDRENPDVVLSDFMFMAAQKLRYKQPTAALAHMPFFRVAEAFQGLAQMCDGIRQQNGFAPLGDFGALMMARDRLLVTSLEALDTSPAAAPLRAKARHVGPILDAEAQARPLAVDWKAVGKTPVILISFSTDPLQVNPELVQRALDGLTHLDARVFATVGGSIDVKTLSCPPNAKIAAYADHDDLMKRASLVVTHGGHGTVMRALKHGVPMIVIPGIAPDQAVNAATVAEFGAGQALPPDANFDQIHSVARAMLPASATFRARAAELSKLFKGANGAKDAADEVDALLAAGRSMAA